MTSYVFEGRDFPGFSQLSVYSHKGLVYSHKGKTRDALKGGDTTLFYSKGLIK